MTTDDYRTPHLTLPALFGKFLRFGCLAFGGPVAQIGMIRHALVEEERWLSPARFNRLLAVMQALPGPEAHELCVHMGMMARGRIGGLLAGLGFMLPGFALMLLAGWLYRGWIGMPLAAGVMLGVQVVVLAVILNAVWRIGGHALENRLLWLLGGLSFAATLLGVPFWIPLVAGGLVSALSGHRMLAAIALALAVLLGWLMTTPPSAGPGIPVLTHTAPTVLALFIAGLKGGLLTFGGAYTAIPYVRADTVGRGWLSDGNFLDGVALAGTLPAPLVIFATFAGYLAGGFEGAVAITLGMFLPAFGFSLVLYERLEAIVENPALHQFLAGVAAAVVGVIAATWLQLARSTGTQVTAPLLATALFAAALLISVKVRKKWITPLLVVAGGLTGALVAL
jgi:chromate transporter